MYAVVQIGSMILRSECITTRSVVWASAAGAGVPTRARMATRASPATRRYVMVSSSWSGDNHAARDRGEEVEVRVIDGLARGERALDRRLHPRERERRVVGDRARQIVSRLLDVRRGHHPVDHADLVCARGGDRA